MVFSLSLHHETKMRSTCGTVIKFHVAIKNEARLYVLCIKVQICRVVALWTARFAVSVRALSNTLVFVRNAVQFGDTPIG